MFKYKIEGLDCPNCAKALEKAINGIDVVESAEIDFLNGELKIDTDNEKIAFAKILEVTKSVEPDARIYREKQQHKKNHKKIIVEFGLLILGIVLGAIALFTNLPSLLFYVLYITSAIMLGYKTYYKALRLLFKGMVNENLLVTLSIFGASLLGEFLEGLMVIALYSIGKFLEGLAVGKSRRAIEKLTKLTPESVVVIVNGKECVTVPENVEIGQTILVKAGERVPIDGIVIEGEATLNLQSLTGESLPATISQGKEILSGSIVLDGLLKIQTTKCFAESTASRIMQLIENASQNKSKTETIISKVAKWYTIGVMIVAVLVFALVWAITQNKDIAIYRGLIFLLVSCPCAFAISVPLSYFAGLGRASKNGILIKGSNYLDACANLNVIAFDKTGTITSGCFKISEVEIVNNNYSKEDIINIASIGERYSSHPLAKAIVRESKSHTGETVDNFKEIAGKGIYFSYAGSNFFVGRQSEGLAVTCVEVLKNDCILGRIYFQDEIKYEAKDIVSELKKMGIRPVLLSGDNEEIVTDVATKTGFGEYKYKLLPEDKYSWIQNNKKEAKIGFVGDGLNDSPALALSDVGFCMGINGSEASIEASDIVLVDDNPNKVATAIRISKHTRKIVWQNIILSAVVKIVFLTLGAIGITGMIWAVIADVGVTLCAILNSLRAL